MHVFSDEDSPVLSLQLGDVAIDRLGRVLNSRGAVASVVRQFDRQPAVARLADALFPVRIVRSIAIPLTALNTAILAATLASKPMDPSFSAVSRGEGLRGRVPSVPMATASTAASRNMSSGAGADSMVAQREVRIRRTRPRTIPATIMPPLAPTAGGDKLEVRLPSVIRRGSRAYDASPN